MNLPPAMVDCSACGTPFEGTWYSDVMDIEQLDGPPVAVQQCPECEYAEEHEYPGWTEFGGAG